MTIPRALVLCASLMLAPLGQQTRPAATGSAAVSGVVVSTANPPQPVRRAIVKISGRGELSRSAVTDDDGKFVIGFLPAGTYTLTVSKGAYLTTTLGAAGPGRPGTPLVIRDAETIANLRIPIIKGAAIAGTIRDFSGDPADGVQVFAARAELTRGRQIDTFLSGPSTFSVTETVTTDDRGAVRIFGLAPGSYIVAALPRTSTTGGVVTPTRDQVDAALRLLQQRASGAAPIGGGAGALDPNAEKVIYAPVYHPSASSAVDAQVVTVGAGEDRRGIDVFLTLVPVATIEGVILGVDGQPAPGVALNISRIGPPIGGVAGLLPLSPLPGPDATFRYTNLAPGQWTLTARVSARVVRRSDQGALVSTSGDSTELPAGPFYWAASTVQVRGGVTRVTLQLRPGFTMTGRVAFDSATPPPSTAAAQVRLSMTSDPDLARVAAAVFPAAPPLNGNPAADGSFELKGLTPGVWQLGAVLPGGSGTGGWWLRSAVMDGKDLLDMPIDVSDRDLSGVVVTLSNRHTELSGSLLTTAGKPASDLAIIVMPAERALWGSIRRVQQIKPATDGRFSFVDLPPGNYVLAAVTDVPPDSWRTDGFLTSIAGAGVKFAIGDGEKKIQDLRVNR